MRVSDFLQKLRHITDPNMPEVPQVEGIVCEDHAAFVVNTRDIGNFTAYWKEQGLTNGPEYRTKKFPAVHQIFAKNPGASDCEQMVGLSASLDSESPINLALRMYGDYWMNSDGVLVPGKLQHVAYSVDPKMEMTDVVGSLERRGVKFMCPILEWPDHETGATLKQIFVACKVPWGPFAELVQRIPGNDGQPFNWFRAHQIDNLYYHYNSYSRRLLASHH